MTREARQPKAKASGAGRRFARALLIVAALVAACCAVDAVLEAARPGVLPSAIREGMGVQGAAEQGNADGQPALPEGFAQEVADLSGAQDVQVAAGGAVVGFTEQGAAADVFAGLAERLAGKGWAPIGSGRDDCGTFVKQDGRFTWMFASCSQVGDAVAVVLQLPAGAQACAGG